MQPHVSILSRKTVFAFLGYECVDNPYKSTKQLFNQVYKGLQPLALAPVQATFARADYFDKSLAMIVESEQVASEIRFARNALERVMGRRIEGVPRIAHITIGRLINLPRPELQDRILQTAEENTEVLFCQKIES